MECDNALNPLLTSLLDVHRYAFKHTSTSLSTLQSAPYQNIICLIQFYLHALSFDLGILL